MALVKAWSSLNWDAPFSVMVPCARTGIDSSVGAASAAPTRVLRSISGISSGAAGMVGAGLAAEVRPGQGHEGTGW